MSANRRYGSTVEGRPAAAARLDPARLEGLIGGSGLFRPREPSEAAGDWLTRGRSVRIPYEQKT